MIPRPKDLPKLRSDLKKMEEFRRYAKLYGGKISLGDENVTLEKIEELIEHLKFQIASAESVHTDLKLIPKND